MKILNYSSLSLLFMSILQTIAGYTCPSSLAINAKIAENSTMRFPMTEGSDSKKIIFRYRNRKNINEKFYKGNSQIARFVGAYYFPDTPEVPGSLTCTYKQADNKFFLLAISRRQVRRIDESMIANDVNSHWRSVRRTGFYACGKDEIVKEDVCQFSLKPR